MKTAFKYFLSIILVILMFVACSSKPENRSLSEDDITLLRSSTEMVFSKFSSLETGEVSAKIDSYEIQAKLVVSSALSWSMDISVADSDNAARIFVYKLLSDDYADKTRLVSVYLGETEYKVSAEQLFGDSVIPSPAKEPEELGQEQLAILNDSVKESLSNDENVYLRGFGSFIVKKRAQKTARNISKNTTIIIPEHNIPAFKPAKTFTLSVKK